MRSSNTQPSIDTHPPHFALHCRSISSTQPLSLSLKMSNRRSNKGFSLRQPPIVDIGCNCRRPRILSSLFSSHHKPKSTTSSSPSSSTTLATTITTTTDNTISTNDTWDPLSFTTNSLFFEPPFILNEGRPNHSRKPRRKKRTCNNGRVVRESVPVTVDSAEPFEDFRESMVQMIVEKEIYAWDDLNELLHQFLSLNSPRHHPLILHAFADLWTGLFSPPSPCL
ncbi:transcription repressor [Rhynchospora pubera]|uniref:Transcription repressor n=1 Tax=Rhynchospora pubera TaxID=906938 RepID=A0AAV8H6S9_9POAL|nr:transcription repressor [Rhynchospora pubera]